MFGRAVAERPDRPSATTIRTTRPSSTSRAPTASSGPSAIRSFLVAPMIVGDRVFGAMGTYTPRVGAFGEHEIALVRALADHAALGDRERRADRPAGPLPGGGRAAGRRRARPARDRRPDHGRSATRPRSSSSPSTRPPRLLDGRRRPDRPPRRARRRPLLGLRRDDRASCPVSARSPAAARRRPARGSPGGPSARCGRSSPATTSHDDRFEHADAPDAHVKRHAIRSVIAVPLVGDRGPLGTLTVYTGEVDAFTEADARLLEALAGPGRDRDDERPADRGARDVAGGRAAAGGRGAGAPRDRRPDHRDPRPVGPPPGRRRRGRPPAPRRPGPDRPDRARRRARRLHVPRRGPAHRRRGGRRGRRAVPLRRLRPGDRRAPDGRRRRLPHTTSRSATTRSSTRPSPTTASGRS